MPVITRLIAITAGDFTAPTLTSPTATVTGSTTADGSVSTNEGNGTLFYLASTNSTELASTVISTGSSQAVSDTGVQEVSFTGLTGYTQYYAHYVHRDLANNSSARVTSSPFTTPGEIIVRTISITPQAESISSISGSTANSVITVTTGGVYNLNTHTPTLTYGGASCTEVTVTGNSTFTARMPSSGFALGSSNNFVLTVNSTVSSPVSRTFNPTLGNYATLTTAFANFPPDSWARDTEFVGAVEGLVSGDQVEVSSQSEGTTLTPEGYDVNVDGLGNLWITDPSGSEGNLLLETEDIVLSLALIDASDTYSRSNVSTITLTFNQYSGVIQEVGLISVALFPSIQSVIY